MIQSWKLGLATLVMSGAIAFCANCASAQITADSTLPNNSIVTSNGSTLNITGGTQAGSSLFHSFGEFSVPTGGTAFFNNAADIQNILSRVTGKSISNIDGLIRANGTANLFLINPNGIVFGANAHLNIGGSFVASTANSLKFANGSQFSATAAQSAPLLTISVPIGLQFGTNPGKIQVQGNGGGIRSHIDYPISYTTSELVELYNTKFGLRVQPNQTLALVGGDINLEGARLKSAGGRIELGSVENNSLVSLTPISKGFTLGYDGVQNFGNIQLSQQAAVDASGAGSGDIQIWGRRVTVTDGSQVEASTLGAEQGGNIVINAQDSVELIGVHIDPYQFPSSLIANVYPSATGAAGDLTINTRELLVRDGAQVSAGTFGRGNGGNLTVNADSVQLVDGSLYTYTYSAEFSAGSAGNLTLNTRELLAQDLAFVYSVTSGPPGIVPGKGGDLTINTSKLNLVGDRVFVGTENSGAGSAGQLTLKADSVLVQNGARVAALQEQDKGEAAFSRAASESKGGSLTVNAQDVQLIGTSADGQFRSGLYTSTNSSSDAGSLTINTNTLVVKDGAGVSAATSGEGKGGSLTVNAQDVQLIGTSVDGQFRSGLYASAQPNSIGDAGNLAVKTNTLQVRDGASVTVESFGTGTAGNMRLNARFIHLNNNALLSANTQSARVDPNFEQATINIDSQDLIMSRNSNIRTNARGENVIGGNINIDTDLIIAVEDSNITANAQAAFGGRVNIDTQGIFRTADSDFTAYSELGTEFNGTVDINTPGIEPNNGLINLPVQLVEARVAQTCQPSRNQAQSEFVVTGRGGLPPSPDETLSTDAIQVDWVTLNPKVENRNQGVSTNTTTQTPNSIVEATGWTIAHNGDVLLTASATAVLPGNSKQTPAKCHAN